MRPGHNGTLDRRKIHFYGNNKNSIDYIDRFFVLDSLHYIYDLWTEFRGSF